MFATLMAVGNIIGVLLCKFALHKFSYRIITILAPFFHIFFVLGILTLVNTAYAYFLFLLLGISWGFRTNTFLSVSMHFTDKHLAASVYSSIMAFANVGISLGNLASAQMADSLGYTLTFIILASYNCLAIAMAYLMFYFKKKNNNRTDNSMDYDSHRELIADDIELE